MNIKSTTASFSAMHYTWSFFTHNDTNFVFLYHITIHLKAAQ